MFYHLSSSMKSSRPGISTRYQRLTSVAVAEEFVGFGLANGPLSAGLQTAKEAGKLGFSPAFQCLSVCLIRFARWS